MKQKIMLVTYLWEKDPAGGATVVVKRLAEWLKESYDVSILAAAPGKQIHLKIESGVRIIAIPNRNLYSITKKHLQPPWKKVLFQLIDVWNPLIYGTIKKVIDGESPDVVHSHKLRGLSPAVWSAAKACDVPRIVHTCHDFELISPQGTLNGVIGQMARKRSILMRPYQTIRARASSVVNYASAPSLFNLTLHTQTGFFNKAHKAVIPNSHGFSQGRLSIIKKKNKDAFRKNNFLFIGRLDIEKGILLLCDVFERILQKFPQAELHIIGGGPLEDTICERSKKITNIQFHGPMFGEQKEKMLGNCTAVIVPSSAYETFGIVITEAYAFGKPVIASRIGGIPEIVREGITGWLVQPGDATELQNAIENVLENPAMAEAMSLACFDEAQRYASEIVFQQYMDLYSQG